MLDVMYFLVVLATGNPMILPMPSPAACVFYKDLVTEQGFEARCVARRAA